MKMHQRGIHSLRRRLVMLGVTLLAACAALLAGLVIVPALSPATGARTADILRSVVGVQPVADLESLSSRLRDGLNQYRFGHGTPLPQLSWLGRDQPLPDAASAQPPVGPPRTVRAGSLAPIANVVSAAPRIGWQPYGPTIQNAPAMSRSILLVDPHRSYAGVALVRIDLARLALHVMPGIIEPAHPAGIDQAIPSLGMVPPSDRASLVAAFNGGFKAMHGHYGMMDNGFTLLPPVNGMATVAIYKDGSIRMGAWNQDIFATPDIVALRQNCPPLIDAGLVNPALDTDASRAWGFTHNTDITWRTGLGLTQDGRYLIYAVGNGTNARFLARALQEAGAYWAMQLDINQYYAQFDTYSQVNGQPVGQRLLDQMTVNPGQFLTPSVRDFFYLTAR